MKFTKIAALVLLAAILSFSSCAKLYVGNVRPDIAANNEIVFTPELKELLQTKPKPKIVIRVANPSKNVTEADKFNSYINEIEKIFVKNNYIVRDRALLENLMREGNIDYKSIKDKIDTDLIIDILTLDFEKTTLARTFFNKTTEEKESFATELSYVECGIATLECRVTIVDRGQLGGLFTLRTSPCDIQETDFYVDGFRQKMAWMGQEKMGLFPVLRVPITSEEDKRFFTKSLAKRLIALLTSQKEERDSSLTNDPG
jgi:hypothetical protein